LQSIKNNHCVIFTLMKEIPVLADRRLHLVFGITLVAVMGVASLTPVFPDVKKHFNLDAQQIGYLVTVFTLPGFALSVFLGILADRFGRKPVLIPSIFLFAIAGFLCGFADTYQQLLVLRFFQGIGASALGSLNITLIGDIFEGQRRKQAMGYNASVLSIGTASYPALGGVLAIFGWNFPFFLPLLALPAGILVLCCFRYKEPGNDQKLKEYLKQAVTYITGRNIIAVFSLSVLIFIILYGSFLTYFPLMIAQKFSSPAWFIGVILSFSSLTSALISSRMGWLARFYSNRRLLLTAFILYFLSMVAIPAIDNVYLLFVPILFFGVAIGINIPVIQVMLAELAPVEVRAAVMSINGMVLRLGQTIGPVLIGYAFTLFGFTAAFYAGGAVALIMILITLFVIHSDQ